MQILLLDFMSDAAAPELASLDAERPDLRQVLWLAEALNRSGSFKPLLVAPKKSALLAEAAARGLPYKTVGASSAGRLLSRGILGHSLKKNNPGCIIHSHDARSEAFGAKLAKNNPAIFHIHTQYQPPVGPGKWYNCGVTVCVSPNIAKSLKVDAAGQEGIRVIPAAFAPENYPERLPRQDKRLVFICQGDLVAEANHASLLNALAELNRGFFQSSAFTNNYAGWELRLVGEGELFSALIEQATRLGIEKNLAILGPQAVADVLPHADICVQPFANDGKGVMALKEAWATGLPVLCAGQPANLDVVTPEENGLVFSPGNPEELARQLVRLATGADLRARLTAGGKNTLARFTRWATARQYMSLYQEFQPGNAH